MEEINKIVKEEAEKLFEKIGVEAQVKVENEEELINVHVETPENALLIGKHGNTLSSLELVLSLITAKKVGEFRRLVIEVGGYREAREEYLKDLAERLSSEVAESGTEKTIRGLKPWERRVIHMYLGEKSDVLTESTGDDRDRVLVIKRK